MKKLHLGFGIAALAVLVVGLMHGGIAWIVAEATWDPMATSAPTWVAFVLPIVCYSMGIFVILLAWLTAWLIAREIARKRLQKGKRCDIISS